MDTITLTKLMNNDKKARKYFKGCMPRDFLPKKLEDKSLYVINLAASTGPNSEGTHWVLISTLDNDFSAYICSLGTPPTHAHVIDSLFSVKDRVVWSDFKNQGESTVCSYHVLFTASMLARNHKIVDVMTDFYTDESYINDCAVTEILCEVNLLKEYL